MSLTVNTFLRLEITGGTVRLLITASFNKGVNIGVGVSVGVSVSTFNIRLRLAFK